MARSNAGLTVSDSEASVSGIGWPREWRFLGISALLFVAGAWGTIRWCESMSSGMAMPGGWTMSMAWMRMPGQTWLGAAASFVLMWVTMMVAMMLPSLVPMLLRYRGSVRVSDQTRLGRLTALAGAGYLFVWAVFGAAVYPLALVLTAAYMRWSALARSVPVATGFVLLLAGCFQLTRVEGSPAWALPKYARARPVPLFRRSECLAEWPPLGCALQPVLLRIHVDPACHRRDAPRRHGDSSNRDYRRTALAETAAGCPCYGYRHHCDRGSRDRPSLGRGLSL